MLRLIIGYTLDHIDIDSNEYMVSSRTTFTFISRITAMRLVCSNETPKVKLNQGNVGCTYFAVESINCLSYPIQNKSIQNNTIYNKDEEKQPLPDREIFAYTDLSWPTSLRPKIARINGEELTRSHVELALFIP